MRSTIESTVGALAHELRAAVPPLTVVTTGLTALQALADVDDVRVECLGGTLRHVSQGFVGPLAEASLERMTFDRGINEADLDQTRLKELMARAADSVYVLAHADKLGRAGAVPRGRGADRGGGRGRGRAGGGAGGPRLVGRGVRAAGEAVWAACRERSGAGGRGGVDSDTVSGTGLGGAMLTIGEFARRGRVSVRMLRHYDATGLLRPARTDPTTGYRHYTADQLDLLNRVVALKDLGFTLNQVKEIVDGRVGVDRLREMLRGRRAELEAVVAEATARLARVEVRLRSIESEGHMPEHDVVVKSLPAQRVARLSAISRSYAPEDIGPVVSPLFMRLCDLLADAGISMAGPGIALYADAGGGAVTVHAAFPIGDGDGADSAGGAGLEGGAGRDGGFEVVELPAVERAAVIVHRGAMDGVVPTAQALERWVDAHGHRADGYPREVTLEAPERLADWVTELQLPLVVSPDHARSS
ncbi:MerR family transcriptional regulator [Actinosynnema mirum]